MVCVYVVVSNHLASEMLNEILTFGRKLLEYRTMKTTNTLLDYIHIVIKRRVFLLKFMSIALMIVFTYTFMVKPKYTATSTILPPNPQQEMFFNMLGSISPELMAISRMGGMFPGTSNSSDFIAEIMKSSRVAGIIINNYGLMKILRANYMVDAYKRLMRITNITISPEGIIAVSVTHEDKELATNIANSFAEEVDRFVTQTAMTTGKKYRIFIEQRLKETVDTLAQAENALRAFQENNRVVALDVELEAAIETIAQLKSQIILYEVQKSAWTAAGQTDNPYLKSINRELAGLKSQLSKIEFGDKTTRGKEFGAGFSVPFMKLPDVTLEYARLLRDLKIQAAIYELLTQQYEQAKIMELKDTPTLQVLDHAYPPEKKSWPSRGRMLIVTFILSAICGTAFLFILEYFDNSRAQKTEKYRQIVRIWQIFKDDLSRLGNKLHKVNILKPRN